jgi:uncharacterized delta-60 repeat protein
MTLRPVHASLLAALLSIALATVAAVAPVAVAAGLPSGTLDPSFGNGGRVLSDFGGRDEAILAVATAPGGTIVAAGYSAPTFDAVWPAVDFAVARYTRTGRLDQTFGNGGWVTTDLDGHGSIDYGHALVIQRDGRIVVAGSSGPSHSDAEAFALVRYRTDGSLDPTFGVGGKAVNDLAGGHILAIALQPDGKIVAAGSDGSQFALARFRSDGSLDPTFGRGGIVRTDFDPSGLDRAQALALQPDGKIVAAGYSNAGNPALARYNRDGSLDATFGAGGKVRIFVSASTGSATAIAIQHDGRIIIAANSYSPATGEDFALVRYTPTGRLDTTFGSSGEVVTDVSASGSTDALGSLAIAANGTLYAAGRSDAKGTDDVAVARYTGHGILDPSFGDGGIALTDFQGGRDVADGLDLRPNGEVLAAGFSTSRGYDFAMVRYTR